MISRKTYPYVFIGLFLLLAIFQVIYDIDKPPIKIWDESSSARNAIEMLKNGNYLVVENNGKPDHYDSKPPLNVWLKVISYKAWGINEFAVRFPTILAAILTMLAFILFSWRYLKNLYVGAIILALMAITQGYMGYHVARHGDPDSLLILFVSCYFLIFFVLLEKYPTNRVRYLILLGLSIVLAVYTKSIAGLAPLVGIAIYAISQKKFYLLLSDYRFHLTWIGTITIIAAYYIIRELFDPGYIKDGLLHEIKLANSYPGEPKRPDFLFYFHYLRKHGFSPLFYFLPVSIIAIIVSKNKQNKRLIIYGISAALFFWIGQSSLVTKNRWYIAPIYPFLWVILSVSFYEIYDSYLKNIFRKKNLYYSMAVIIIILFTTFYVIKYFSIFTNNQSYKNFTYMPEREGEFLRDLKKIHPEFKDITIVSPHRKRQMDFYKQKFEYDDNSAIQIMQDVSEKLIGKYVLATDRNLKNKLDCQFDNNLIFEGKYGRFYYITGSKEGKSYTCSLEEMTNTKFNKFIAPEDSSFLFYTAGISDEKTLSGNCSVKLNKDQKYGLSSSFINENICSLKMSAWKTNNDDEVFLVLNMPGIGFYKQSNRITEKLGNWEKIELFVKLPAIYNGEKIHTYVWYPGQDSIYLDDLEIEIY